MRAMRLLYQCGSEGRDCMVITTSAITRVHRIQLRSLQRRSPTRSPMTITQEEPFDWSSSDLIGLTSTPSATCLYPLSLTKPLSNNLANLILHSLSSFSVGVHPDPDPDPDG